MAFISGVGGKVGGDNIHCTVISSATGLESTSFLASESLGIFGFVFVNRLSGFHLLCELVRDL